MYVWQHLEEEEEEEGGKKRGEEPYTMQLWRTQTSRMV